MRFVFDELLSSDDDELDREPFDVNRTSPCSSPEPSINEISFVNPNEEDEDVPHLFLPKRKLYTPTLTKYPTPDDTASQLDPELEQLMGRLNLRAKLPSADHINLPVIPIKDSCMLKKKNESYRSEENTEASYVNPKSVISAIQSSFHSRVKALESVNKEEIGRVKTLKKHEEEERRRKEEEERRKLEEEERRKREEEAQKLRKIEEEKRREEELRRLKEQEREAKEKAERDAKEAQEKEKLKQNAIKARTVTNFSVIEKSFWNYKEKISSIKKDIVEPVKKADPALRSLLSRHKRKINPKFGQLTNSNEQLQKIQHELCNLVDQTKDNNLAFRWILNFIAKAMVHQAETEVRVKPESALPLSKLAINLMVRYPELREFLMARLVKKCPYVIGFTCNIDTESGRQNMGWKRKSDDKWEEDTSYDERMGGMVTFFAVITRLPLPQEFINSVSHPMPISESWHILARISNTPTNLLTNSHFVVLGSWWDAAAAQFLQAYGNQGGKLLQLLGDNLTLAVADLKYVGAARLRILLEEWQTTGMKTFPEMTA